MSSTVWFITACSSGFGREIAIAALNRGDHVIATARDLTKLEDLKARGATVLALDVCVGDARMQSIVEAALAVHGRIDILVNNAGYVLQGAVEECSASEVQAQFDTNVFGQLTVLRAVLPHMRSRRSGVIANMGSMGGWTGVSGAGLHCASKFALVGISEALKKEVAHLGIDVTIIEPGNFRTQFFSHGHRVKAEAAIDDLHDAVEPTQKAFDAYNLTQPGDPAKGARFIVEALSKSGRCEGRTLPARLPLGRDSVKVITSTLDRNRQNLDEWKELVLDLDCDDIPASK